MRRKVIILWLVICLAGSACCGVWWVQQHTSPSLQPVTFARLPGWQAADVKSSLQAFKLSCAVFLKQAPETFVGSNYFNIQAKDWHPICHALSQVDMQSEAQSRAFFQTWFVPMAFYKLRPVRGLFTGYYLPLLHGSLQQSARYHVPIYRTPDNLIQADLGQFNPQLRGQQIKGRIAGQRLVPYYDRAEINQGAIDGHAEVVVWVDSPIDRLFLEIQGSGVVSLDDGSSLYLGYAAQNGAPYTAIGQVLIKRGVMTKENASMQTIKAYLQAHPAEMAAIIDQNKSFVFFDKLPKEAAIGSQGIALTQGYSLAVDRQFIPLGLPIWLDTTRPAYHTDNKMPLQRLMIAQDTGGAIRGMVRGDVFWGAGERATAIAGRMKNTGYYWLLLPRSVAERSLRS